MLGSPGLTWLATLRWTKRSPTLAPITASAGTLESEHPIQRYLGFWPA